MNFARTLILIAGLLGSFTATAATERGLTYVATCSVFLNANKGGTHENVANVDVDISAGRVTEVFSNGALSFKVGMHGDVPGQGKDLITLSIIDLKSPVVLVRTEIAFKATPEIAEYSLVTGLRGGIVFECYPRWQPQRARL
jgi:hypothetical protein